MKDNIFYRLPYLITSIGIFLLLQIMTLPLFAQTLWVEAEQFEHKGGWVVDAQFMDQMGSPYLMAHGNGCPVEDATTSLQIDKADDYHVWVRTYNWNAPWNDKQYPGIFKLFIDNRQVGDVLGTTSQWGWQYAGKSRLQKGKVQIKLHDLTGFAGRCDAIVLSTDAALNLPASGEKLSVLRRQFSGVQKIVSEEKYDLVVVGGGVGGLCTSIAAARLGLKTLMIQNRPVVGGNNSPEVSIGTLGGIRKEPYPEIGNVLAELGNIYKNYALTEKIISEEKNLTVVYNQHVFAVTKRGTQIHTVIAKDITTGKEYEYAGSFFSDCTGDGNLGYLAGADYRMGRELRSEFNEDMAPEVNDSLTLGATVKWQAQQTDTLSSFPTLPWAVKFTERTCQKVMGFVWYWETGFYKNQITDAEQIRDYWFRVIYGNWSYLKNNASFKSEYAKSVLNDVSFILGKRESRRLMGDYILTQRDILEQNTGYTDGTVVATYSIDQHFPHPENSVYFPREEFLSVQKHNDNPIGKVENMIAGKNVNKPYLIPFRCLYSRNISNMFMAGRNISVTRIALASTRVQGTIGMMGEVVAIGALLCKEKKCQPKDIYEQYLPELKKALIKGIPSKNRRDFNPVDHL